MTVQLHTFSKVITPKTVHECILPNANVTASLCEQSDGHIIKLYNE